MSFIDYSNKIVTIYKKFKYSSILLNSSVVIE